MHAIAHTASRPIVQQQVAALSYPCLLCLQLLKEATKAYKASYMVFSASSDGTRFGIYASTPKGGLDAKAWCAAAGEPSNAAKVNGGPTQANAMVIRANQHLDACMAAAEEFAAQNA